MSNMNLKVFGISILAICGIVGFIQLGYSSGSNAKATMSVASEQKETQVLQTASITRKPNVTINIDADYSDGVRTIDALKKNADLIVYGQVVSQVQYSEYSVASTVRVSKHKKGKAPELIRIFQIGTLGSDEVLANGQSYLLFLGKQTDDQEDTYFIKGGSQGLVDVYDNNIHFRNNVMDSDYTEKFLAVKDAEKSNAFEEWLNK